MQGLVRIAATVVVVAAGLVGFGAAASAAPRMVTVSPDRGLGWRTTVTVTGTDFAVGHAYVTEQCTEDFGDPNTGPIPYHACIGSKDRPPVVADAGGRITTQFRARRLLLDNDCASAIGTCYLRVRPSSSPDHAVDVPLGFDPASAPAPKAGPDVSITDATTFEPVGTVVTSDMQIRLSHATDHDVTARWILTPRGAAANPGPTLGYPGDTTRLAGNVTVPAGYTSNSLGVRIVGDPFDEPTERFDVALSLVDGGPVADGRALQTILDDDPTPNLTMSDVQVAESAGEARVEVRLSARSARTIAVEYATAPIPNAASPATAGADYVAKHQTLTFLPGEVRHVIRVQLVDDALREDNEVFNVLVVDANDVNVVIGRVLVDILAND